MDRSHNDSDQANISSFIIIFLPHLYSVPTADSGSERDDESLLPQRKEPAEVLVVHVERGVLVDVRREEGPIGPVDPVALLRLPVR